MALACNRHGSAVRYHCEQCSEHMCPTCLASGAHHGHKFYSLSKLFESEHDRMQVVQEQVKETMRVISTLAKRIDDEDVRLERSYELTRSHVENVFRSVDDLANDRERTLIEQVDGKQAEFVSKLELYYTELDAAEKNCQHWLERKQEVIKRLKNNDISATGEYNNCMAGLKQAEQAVKELNSQLVEILQRPPVITFTCNVQQADELKKAIRNLGEFDKYTTTTFQEPEKMTYYECSNEFPEPYTLPDLPNQVPNEDTDSANQARPKPERSQYKAISADHVSPPTQYELPTCGPSQAPSPCQATSIQPDMVIPHFQMRDCQDVSGALPTRTSIYCNSILVTEEGSIRCLQNGMLAKKITKVGRTKLRQPEGITYYRQKGKFLVVDSFSKKLIKVKPDTGKTDEVDLPHIITPGDITITTGPIPTIFITDKHSLCVLKYSTNGAYQGGIPLQGLGAKRPVGIAYMAGFLYIADIECHCIFKFDTEGVFSGKIGSHGNAPGCLNQPYGITALPGEKLAITESGNHRVSVFDSEGQFVQCFGAKGRDLGMFNTPKGISADSSRLVVVDYSNKRVQVFSLDTIMAEAHDHELYEACNYM